LRYVPGFCHQTNPYINAIVRQADAIMEKMTVTELI
jgi:hypothetical protein